MTRIVVVSAGLSQPSTTRMLADRLATAAEEAFGSGPATETVELRDYAHDITDNLLTGFPGQRLREVLDSLAAADGLILVTPTFTGSYSGLFKSFIDVLDPETVRGKPVVLAATGGTQRHSLVLEHALRPLLTYLHAATVPTSVYAANSDWGDSGELGERITRAATELAAAVRQRPAPQQPDPFTDPVPFEQLLRDTAA